MGIQPPGEVWWKPIDKEEKIWFILALIWMLFTFFLMPVWHVIGAQNPSSESYKVSTSRFMQLTNDFIEKYQVYDENGDPVTENGIPVVHPDPDDDVFLMGKVWSWEPILELEKGETYRVHLSSIDLEHGLSIYPLNINYMAIPGQDYVLTITPTSSGEYALVCNEFCGLGHHTMVGKMIVE